MVGHTISCAKMAEPIEMLLKFSLCFYLSFALKWPNRLRCCLVLAYSVSTRQMGTSVRHASFMRHFKKKYADCMNTKYEAEIWYRIA